MGRQRYTLADLKARLSERLGPNEKFWPSAQEQKDAINEAISVWQALTGEWTTSIEIGGKSQHRNFYPVPRQIVSLTRVSWQDGATHPLSPLRAHIVPIGGMEWRWLSDTQIEFWASIREKVVWNVIPSGGTAPYTFAWSFAPDGGGWGPSLSTEEGPTLDVPEVAGAWTATCVVTDDLGTAYTASFPFVVAALSGAVSGTVEIGCAPQVGVTVELWVDGVYHASMVTDDLGAFLFSGLVTGAMAEVRWEVFTNSGVVPTEGELDLDLGTGCN